MFYGFSSSHTISLMYFQATLRKVRFPALVEQSVQLSGFALASTNMFSA